MAVFLSLLSVRTRAHVFTDFNAYDRQESNSEIGLPGFDQGSRTSLLCNEGHVIQSL